MKTQWTRGVAWKTSKIRRVNRWANASLRTSCQACDWVHKVRGCLRRGNSLTSPRIALNFWIFRFFCFGHARFFYWANSVRTNSSGAGLFRQTCPKSAYYRVGRRTRVPSLALRKSTIRERRSALLRPETVIILDILNTASWLIRPIEARILAGALIRSISPIALIRGWRLTTPNGKSWMKFLQNQSPPWDFSSRQQEFLTVSLVLTKSSLCRQRYSLVADNAPVKKNRQQGMYRLGSKLRGSIRMSLSK